MTRKNERQEFLSHTLGCLKLQRLPTTDRLQSLNLFKFQWQNHDPSIEIHRRLLLLRATLAIRNIKSTRSRANIAKSQARSETVHGLANATEINANLISLIAVRLNPNRQCEAQSRDGIAREVEADLAIVDTVGISSSLSLSPFLDQIFTLRQIKLLSYAKNLRVLSAW